MRPTNPRKPITTPSRRGVLMSAGVAAASAALGARAARGAAAGSERGFTVAERRGRWWLIAPDGHRFFSLGFNHIDSAPLRNPRSGNIWHEKYGNSTERWLKEAVAPDLREWGFNSVGWTQEVVVRGDVIQRHSPPFTLEEYQWLGLPYCHLLPFAELHQWERETRYPDFHGKDFEAWCDYVARTHCARMAGDPKLIGYFYSDCPAWTHAQRANPKGPIFDPTKLGTEAGRTELFELATRYYQVTHAAVRRYDKHHLIFGDRYEARAPIAAEVLRAAKPFTDVFCFQHFGKPAAVAADLRRWNEQLGKPVLLADHADSVTSPDGTQRHDEHGYPEMLRLLRDVNGCVGFHLCGAYLRNDARRRGLRDARGRPDAGAIAAIRTANLAASEWVAAQ